MAETTSEQHLLEASSLQKLQSYVKTTGIERGFSEETAQDSFMLLIEELGQVAKAMRPLYNVKVTEDSAVATISHELADVQLLLLSLCNALGVDRWDAVLAKERISRSHIWN